MVIINYDSASFRFPFFPNAEQKVTDSLAREVLNAQAYAGLLLHRATKLTVMTASLFERLL
jgi:hypothetical protein